MNTIGLAIGLSVLAVYVLLSQGRFVDWLRSRFGKTSFTLSLPVAALFGTGLLYGLASGQLEGSGGLKLGLYLLLPLAAILLRRRISSPAFLPGLLLAAAVLLIWLPIESGWVPKLGYPDGGPVPLEVVLAIILAFYLFLVVHPIGRIGYTFHLTRKDWGISLAYFALFMTFFAIPLGVPLEFVKSNEAVSPPWEWPLVTLGILFLIAIPEELLFRGTIQNLLERALPKGKWLPLVLASLIFGFAHSNNANPPYVELNLAGTTIEFPWVYVLLATIAGLFYGLTYYKTRKIMAAALVHCLVDAWWVIFFRG